MRRLIALLSIVALLSAALPASSVLSEEPAGPLETVTIVRDEFGVPHIYADSLDALWYANGYVQAQDRLWAMDLLRHLGYGEGASVVGPGGGILEMDLNTRRNLYTRAQLETMRSEAAPAFQRAVEQYSEGVNRAYQEMVATGDVPAEFPALQHDFEPWKPLDTIAVATFLLAEFGNGGGGELGNAKLLAQLQDRLGETAGYQALEDLLWVERGSAYPTIPEDEALYTLTPQSGAKTLSELDPAQVQATEAAVHAEVFGLDYEALGPLETVGFFAGQQLSFQWGSNALLIAPSLSESGKALQGGGPQMGYFNPQVPYEVGLHLTDGSLAAEGMGVTGAPGVIIGRAGNFSWTVTSGISDQADMVALPAAAERAYEWNPGDVRELDCRTERHELFTPPATGGPDYQVVEQEVCNSHVGPIVATSDTDDDGSPDYFFAKHTSSRAQEVASAISWLTVSTRDNLEDFRGMFEDFAFTFNFHYAGLDAAGDEVACYHHVGLQPVRNNDLDPRFPTPAGDQWDWEGFLTGAELPRACNPAQGYFAQWNNLPQRGWSSGDSRELWGSVHRVERLDAEVQQALADDDNGKLDLEQVKEILREAATHDSLAAGIVPLLIDHAPQGATGGVAALQAWADADYPWDEMVTVDDQVYYAHPGMTVYENVTERLLTEIYGDELGPHVRSVNWDPRRSGDPHAGDHGQHNNPFAIVVDALTGVSGRNWCNDVTTTTEETCADQVADAFAATGMATQATSGEVPLTEEHRSPFTSLGLGPAYSIPMTNRATYYHFHVGSDTTTSASLLPPGSSGHFNPVEAALSLGLGIQPEHNNDQLDRYVDFDLKSVPWTLEEARDMAESEQVLVVPNLD